MGIVIIPRASGKKDETENAIQLYYEENGWLENDEFRRRYKERFDVIGADTDSSAYTKRTQNGAYYNFLEWEDIHNQKSRRRITERGKKFWEHLQAGDMDAVHEDIMCAFEQVVFGRNNYGCPSSDSDFEPPAVFLHAALRLNYVTNDELAYLLYLLEGQHQPFDIAISEIKQLRKQKITPTMPKEYQSNDDPKPIIVLREWGVLEQIRVGANQPHRIADKFLKKYEQRIRALSLVNAEKTTTTFTPLITYVKQDFLKEAFLSTEEYDELVELLLYKKNVILQGAPGVGKTFLAKRLAYSIMGVASKYHVEMVQFHQNYSYEDFIMGYKPTGDSFELQEGVFYRFCKKAAVKPGEKFFFIIDEINRGNLSKIFGELMMLIEADKRDEQVTLAYRDEKFNVPENVYIIGMMNTADRSLALLDYALRRRFSFFEVTPAFGRNNFKDYLKTQIDDDGVIDLLNKRLSELNEFIADEDRSGLGSGFRIGHSYFCNGPAEGQKADQWYRTIIKYEIGPMLDEYWWDDKDLANERKKELLGE